MTPYRYFLSSRITDPSPPIDELLSVEAESPAAAATQLLQRGLLPEGWESQWIHFLEWTSKNGTKHGFYSLRLSDVLKSPRTDK
jgi:hypothetical protein